jgi:hypothetical protein
MDAVKVGFEVGEDHLALWDRKDWRYAFLMGGRDNGRSGTASRYVVSRLLGKEYTRGASATVSTSASTGTRFSARILQIF